MGNVLGGQIDRFWGWRNAFIIAGAPGLCLTGRTGIPELKTNARPRYHGLLSKMNLEP
jgi:hypothetical protein